MTQSENQKRRQSYRSRTGRYDKTEKCELCKGHAGVDYSSWQWCDEYGVGVVLCEKCCGRVSPMLRGEAARLLGIEPSDDRCRICLISIDSCELCATCAVGNDPFFQSKYSDLARGSR
jgi:hypothetical protein